MKLAFVCMKESERFQIRMPLCYHVKVVMSLSSLVQNFCDRTQKAHNGKLTIETVKALRNKVALKNAFMKYVVRDSLPWAKDQIKEEIGAFGKHQYVVREYYEEIEQENKEEENERPKNSNTIEEEKPENEEEKFTIKRIFLNPKKEEFVNNPIHKKHLTSKSIFEIMY
jgi:hypothetical protein